jgi:DNA-binding response OmpR family regulator
MSATTIAPTPFNRKVIHAAGILIVQPDADLAGVWRDALIDFGMAGVHVVGDADAAVHSIKVRPPSGVVIALPHIPDAHGLVARLESGEAGPLDQVPIVLVMPRPTRSAVIAAAAAGFDAVLPSPLSPRLIYRRMGSLMQRARRHARQNSAHLSLAGALDQPAGSDTH